MTLQSVSAGYSLAAEEVARADVPLTSDEADELAHLIEDGCERVDAHA